MEKLATDELFDIFEPDDGHVKFKSENMTQEQQDRVQELFKSMGVENIEFIFDTEINIDDKQYLVNSFLLQPNAETDSDLFSNSIIYLYSVEFRPSVEEKRKVMTRFVLKKQD